LKADRVWSHPGIVVCGNIAFDVNKIGKFITLVIPKYVSGVLTT
jgi:hypothetical protein